MIIKRDIYYPPAGSSRRLHIYLPDDYHKSEERYPVMYFFDGHNLFFNEDATYGKSWGLKEFLDGWNRKMIVVGTGSIGPFPSGNAPASAAPVWAA